MTMKCDKGLKKIPALTVFNTPFPVCGIVYVIALCY